MQTIEVIQQAHVARMLLFILEDGPMAKGVLYQKMQKNNEVLRKKVEDLIHAKLMIEERVKDDKDDWVKMLSLTPKGRRVAEKLRDIEQILSEG